MKFKFLGGADEVGRLGMILEEKGKRFLFEYGITPGKPPKFPLDAPKPDAIFLTHAHLDHSGMLPYLTLKYSVPVYGTPLTLELSDLLLRDSVKVMNLEGYNSPFEIENVDELKKLYVGISLNKKLIIDDFEVIPYSSGHIPGSAMFLVKNDRSIIFTGDLQTIDTHLMNGCTYPETDILFIESTYAGKEHPPREITEARFLKKIEEILERKGKVLIPAFAVSRTQELMMVMQSLEMEYWVDGMSNAVNQIFASYGSYLRDSQEFKRARKWARKVRNRSDRKKALESGIIITTGGMLEGGPVLYYLEQIKNDPKSGVIITGYQVEGTNGRMLLETGFVDINGVKEKINAEIVTFDFSAHAGNSDILKFIEKSKAHKVILFHGENREVLLSQIENKEVILPTPGEYYEI
ncbi:MAG: MBL fold metallo-hydrolase [Thermoplasmata archaeon]